MGVTCLPVHCVSEVLVRMWGRVGAENPAERSSKDVQHLELTTATRGCAAEEEADGSG